MKKKPTLKEFKAKRIKRWKERLAKKGLRPGGVFLGEGKEKGKDENR